MRSKIPLRWSLIILGSIGIAFFGILIGFFLELTPPGSISFKVADVLAASTTIQVLENPSDGQAPLAWLAIPKLRINAAIEKAGVTPQGAMAVPKGPSDVAWFDLGPRPGEKGSAVIAGHEGWKNGIAAVFDNLSKLHKGDKVYVANKDGTTATFVVRELRLFGENDYASAVFGSSDGKAHLNLITCEGIWNKARKSYSNRLVVFTDKVAE